MAENEAQSLLELEQLINKTTKNLGNGFHNVRYNLETPADAFYLSEMFFVNITADNGNEEKKKTIRLVIKKPAQLANLRLMMRSDEQFHNEILFYQKYAIGHKDVPACYYAHEEPPTKSVFVLENVEERGFHLCPWRCRVPMDYTVAALKELARFHAKGYVMRDRRRSEFFDFVGSLHESRYPDDDPDNSVGSIVNLTAVRGVEYLREHGHDEDFCGKMTVFFENAYENLVKKSIKPVEPLATLCHGDCTLNNILFKQENGNVKAMFIDFALARYGSPVIDISTYLCLHCAEELDKDMIDSALKVYNDSLMQCLEENGIENRERFSYEALRDDYKKKGLFGYTVATFFLAVCMGKSKISTEEMANLNPNDRGLLLKSLGGEEVAAVLASMLIKLQEFGCLDHALRIEDRVC